MKLQTLTAQERLWMLNRLKKSGRLMAILVLLNLLTSFGLTSSNSPREVRATVTPQIPEVPQESSVDSGSGRKLNPVPPIGWRRTNRGWEHVSSWTSPTKSIESLMETQAAREPAFARGLLARVSKLSPVTFAMCQVVAILAIAGLASIVPRKHNEDVQRGATHDRSLVPSSDG